MVTIVEGRGVPAKCSYKSEIHHQAHVHLRNNPDSGGGRIIPGEQRAEMQCLQWEAPTGSSQEICFFGENNSNIKCLSLWNFSGRSIRLPEKKIGDPASTGASGHGAGFWEVPSFDDSGISLLSLWRKTAYHFTVTWTIIYKGSISADILHGHLEGGPESTSRGPAESQEDTRKECGQTAAFFDRQKAHHWLHHFACIV